jgi:hypothetical protein
MITATYIEKTSNNFKAYCRYIVRVIVMDQKHVEELDQISGNGSEMT